MFIAVAVKGDKIAEPNETFNVILNNPVNATIADGVATGTIVNNAGSSLDASANKLITSASVQVSPNPASAKANVLIQGYSGDVTILLSTMEGKMLKQNKLKLASGLLQRQLDVSSYPNGTYLVTVIDEKENRQTTKLVISR